MTRPSKCHSVKIMEGRLKRSFVRIQYEVRNFDLFFSNVNQHKTGAQLQIGFSRGTFLGKHSSY